MATYQFTLYEDGVRTLRSIEDTQVILNVEDGASAAGATGDAHAAVEGNPHNATAADIGAVDLTDVGVANGVASLGEDGRVPAGQLPEALGEDGFGKIVVSGQSDVEAGEPFDTLTLVAGANISIATDPVTNSVTLTAIPAEDTSNAFANVAVSGQSTVVAGDAADTITFAAGSNVTLTTNAGTKTVTISVSLAAAAAAREGKVTPVTGSSTIGLNESVIIFRGVSAATGTLTPDTSAGKLSVVNHGTANYTIQPDEDQTLNGGNITLVPGTATCLVREGTAWWVI